MLPFGRLAKGYSMVLNVFGRVGPVPEGMSAAAALRHKRFSQKHAALKARLLALAARYRRQNGYPPPYWELIRLVRQTKVETQTKR